MKITCIECYRQAIVRDAEWFVWFDTGTILGFSPYTYLCDEHLAAARRAWKDTKTPLTIARPIQTRPKERHATWFNRLITSFTHRRHPCSGHFVRDRR